MSPKGLVIAGLDPAIQSGGDAPDRRVDPDDDSQEEG
jgi:hypothetical protein